MARLCFKSLAVVLAIFLGLPPAVQNSYSAQYYSNSSSFSDYELDQIMSPIALYPDPLLAQILPAASFVNDVSDAQRMLNGRVDESLIEREPWDISVKAIAHYPTVLEYMAENTDWTVALGQAYITQRPDVERSIQRLRAEARQAGILQSNAQQLVIVDQPNVIRIEPAEPQFIYIPQYDPSLVWSGYGYPGHNGLFGLITFGSGLALGAWLNRDWDWYHRGPYYHGWMGGGWIAANRAFVGRNNFYVNNRYRDIPVNRTVVNRNVNDFRSRIDRNPTIRAKPAASGPATTPAIPPVVTAPAGGVAPRREIPPDRRKPGVTPTPTTPPITTPQREKPSVTPPPRTAVPPAVRPMPPARERPGAMPATPQHQRPVTPPVREKPSLTPPPASVPAAPPPRITPPPTATRPPERQMTPPPQRPAPPTREKPAVTPPPKVTPHTEGPPQQRGGPHGGPPGAEKKGGRNK
jgi:hypothetical protein